MHDPELYDAWQANQTAKLTSCIHCLQRVHGTDYTWHTADGDQECLLSPIGFHET